MNEKPQEAHFSDCLHVANNLGPAACCIHTAILSSPSQTSIQCVAWRKLYDLHHRRLRMKGWLHRGSYHRNYLKKPPCVGCLS